MTTHAVNMAGKVKPLLLVAAFAMGLHGTPVSAQVAGVLHTIDLPEGDLAGALDRLGEQAGVLITYEPGLVRGLRAPRVSGQMKAGDVLTKLLLGTRIEVEVVNDRAFVLKRPAARQVQPDVPKASEPVRPEKDPEADPKQLERVRVTATGTNIRNVEQILSPITSVSREELDRQGFPSVVEYLQQLPQNFGGTVSPDRAGGGGSGAGATAVNLRNTGPEATLVLLNGRRIAPSGTTGDFVDLSSIAGAALKRMDILTDGASAIYGSDAVAGVVNIILDQEYVGSQTRLQFGSAGSDAQNYGIGHTAGFSGDKAYALVAVDYARADALHARDRNFASGLGDVAQLLPATEKHSALLTGGIHLGENTELFADVTYSDRQASQITDFGLLMENITDVNSGSVSAGALHELTNEWVVEAGMFYSANRFDGRTAYGYLTPDAMSMLFRSRDEIGGAEAKAEGVLLQTAAGQARMVVGAQFRNERHDGYQAYYYPDGVVDGKQFDGVNARDVKAMFGEIYLPLVGEQNAGSLARSLDLSLAARYERYSDFGSTFNPKLAIAWSPTRGITFRGGWGSSYRAPRLQQMVDHITGFWIVDYLDPDVPGGMSVAANVLGTEPTLRPEESTSRTLGIDLQPAGIPNLFARLTLFDIDYRSRIASPYADVDPETFVFHSYNAAVVRDRATILDYYERADSFFNYTTYFDTGSQSSLEDVTVLLSNIAMNTAQSRRTGADIALKYSFPLRASEMQFSLDAAYIHKAYDQFLEGGDKTRVVGRVSHPARVKGNAGFSWAGSSVSWGASANYISSTVDDRSLGELVNVEPWLTWNAFFGYRFGSQKGPAMGPSTSVNVAIRNVLDNDPPRVLAAVGSSTVNYDTANADPEGRSLLLTFVKEW